MLGNAGTLIAFRLGGGDAAVMAREFEPHFEGRHFVGLPNHTAYMRLLIGGQPSQPFSATFFGGPQRRMMSPADAP